MCHFTVVIPTYNRSQLVQRAIESVLAQTVPASQIVVVDDGSTDNTSAVCRKYGPAVTYARKKNGGVSSARNHGVRLAEHPWTAFLDSDDHWTPTHLERIAEAIRATDGRARFYFTDVGHGTDRRETSLWTSLSFHFQDRFLFCEDATAWMLARHEPCSIQCSVFDTGIFRYSGGFDPRYRVTEDRELFYRLGIGGPACAVNTVGCIKTADDVHCNRLTGIIDIKSQGFWEHEQRLWSDLLTRFPNLAPTYRDRIRNNLAVACWRLSRLHWVQGCLGRSLGHLWITAKAQPHLLLWLMRRRTSDGWRQPELAAPLNSRPAPSR